MTRSRTPDALAEPVSSGRGRHGVVTLAALDVRPRPAHEAELISQLLTGETVEILAEGRGGDWLRVRNRADGYTGWVRSWGIRRASRVRVDRWRALARGRVVRLFVEVWSRPRGGVLLGPLVWNGRVIAGRVAGGTRPVELPDGRRGFVPAAALAGARPPDLFDRIRGLLGVPYLWGGRTPLGLDCSGFTQQVLAEQGCALPRDAHEQYLATRGRFAGGEPRPGDLVFFGRLGKRVGHVGIALGEGGYAHARGWVRLNSLDPASPLFEAKLRDQLRGFGRP